jgi:glycosyltransferase involved in cell wall biosynthesis
MHVLMISTLDHIPWGGCEELWSKSALALIQLGCKVTVSVKAWPSEHPSIRLLSQHGASVRYRRSLLYQRLLRRWRYPRIASLRRTQAHMVVISQACNFDGVDWMEACLASGTPYATISQAAVPWRWPSDELAHRLRKGYFGAQRAYFVSQENLELTQRQLGCVLHNGVVVRNPFKIAYDVDIAWPPEANLRWGCVARLDTYIKGLDILFDVLSQDKWRSRPIQVTIYGTGSNEKSLERARASMSLSNVKLGGFVPDPTEIWRKEHCLILPSRAEGLPLAIVEAMLCGRPSIVTNASGNRELLEDNVTGFIAASPTVRDLDEAMERAWQNRASWRAMGGRAAASVRLLVPPDPARVFADDLLALRDDQRASPYGRSRSARTALNV